MKLYGSTTSPYVRIIRATAIELSIDSNINIIWNSLLDSEVKDELTKLNPLTKIPFLIDGDVHVADTINIFNYLQEKTNNYSLELNKDNIWQETFFLTQIFGALDAGVLFFYEMQGNEPNNANTKKYIQRIDKALSYLERNIDKFKSSLSILTLSIVATYGFFNFRMKENNYFGNSVKLEALVNELLKRDSLKNTQPYVLK